MKIRVTYLSILEISISPQSFLIEPIWIYYSNCYRGLIGARYNIESSFSTIHSLSNEYNDRLLMYHEYFEGFDVKDDKLSIIIAEALIENSYAEQINA